MPVLPAAAGGARAVTGWASLLPAPGGYGRTDRRLRAPRAARAAWPAVAAVVPARNEAAVLPATLPTLLAQEYPGAFEVVLVDDESSDQTADVASNIGRAAGGARLRVVPGRHPPPGWAGKVWAMDQGLRAAGNAAYVLFTDADIAYDPGTLPALVRPAQPDA